MLRMVDAIVSYSLAAAAPASLAVRSWLVAMRVRTTQRGLVTTSVRPPAAAAAVQCTAADVTGSPLARASLSLATS